MKGQRFIALVQGVSCYEIPSNKVTELINTISHLHCDYTQDYVTIKLKGKKLDYTYGRQLQYLVLENYTTREVLQEDDDIVLEIAIDFSEQKIYKYDKRIEVSEVEQ